MSDDEDEDDESLGRHEEDTSCKKRAADAYFYVQTMTLRDGERATKGSEY